MKRSIRALGVLIGNLAQLSCYDSANLIGINMALYKKLAILALVVLIVLGAYNWTMLATLGSNEWAAWVQAVGSIIAIAAGFGVAIYQAKTASELAQRTQAQTSFDQINTVVEILKFANDIIRKALDQMDDPNFVSSYHEGMADPINFKSVEIALSGIPISALKSAEMIECFFRVQDCQFRLKGMVDGSAEDANLGNEDFREWQHHLVLIRREHDDVIFQIDRIFQFARRELEET